MDIKKINKLLDTLYGLKVTALNSDLEFITDGVMLHEWETSLDNNYIVAHFCSNSPFFDGHFFRKRPTAYSWSIRVTATNNGVEVLMPGTLDELYVKVGSKLILIDEYLSVILNNGTLYSFI